MTLRKKIIASAAGTLPDHPAGVGATMAHTLPEIPEDMKAIHVVFKDGYSAFYFKPMDDEMFNEVALHLVVEKMKREDNQ